MIAEYPSYFCEDTSEIMRLPDGLQMYVAPRRIRISSLVRHFLDMRRASAYTPTGLLLGRRSSSRRRYLWVPPGDVYCAYLGLCRI